MSFKHYIEGTEIFPKGMRSSEITENKEIGQKRIKCPTSITLIGDDYTYVKTLEPDDSVKYSYELKKDDVVKAQAEFVRNDMDFNEVKKICVISLNAYDEYTVINEIQDEEVNVLDIEKFSITAELKSYLVFYVDNEDTGAHVPDNFKKYYNWRTYIHNNIYPEFNEDIYAQERIIVDKNRTLTGWVLLDESSGDFKLYGREFDEILYGKPTDNDIKNNIDQYAPVIEDSEWKLVDCIIWGWASEIPPIERGYVTKYNGLAIKRQIYVSGEYCDLFTTYSNAIKLKDALNKIFLTLLPDYLVVSTLLFKDVNAPGEPDFYTDYASKGKNYAGNIPQGDFYLIHKSDFASPNATQPTTKGMLKWKDWVDYMKPKFQGYWHIDSTGNVRIEQICYYEELQSGVKIEDTSQNYSYTQSETPARQVFEEIDSYSEDFTKKEITYANVPVLNGEEENKEEFSMNNFSTDIDGMNQRLDSIGTSGWVLVEATGTSSLIVPKKLGHKSGKSIQNGNLSTINCLWMYFRYYAYKDKLTIDGTELDNKSKRKQKKQTITFESDEEIDILKSIETDLGTGEFVSLKYNPVNSANGVKYTAEVIYD